MITIANRLLRVGILDPATDSEYFGSRYCTGGYIWQVTDTRTGQSLLSGPRFPDKAPPQFDGQGAPEAFVTLLGDDTGLIGAVVSVIGVGEVKRSVSTLPFSARDNPEVQAFCTWNVVRQSGNSIEMNTHQENGRFRCRLVRSVALEDTCVSSITTLHNTSEEELPVRWFPHPFLPLNPDLKCATFGIPWELPENPAYSRDEHDILCMNRNYHWPQGLFLKLDILSGKRFSAELFHPVCRKVTLTCDYPAAELPFWANDNTFSPEPYLETIIVPGQEARWLVRYRFG